MVDASQCSVNSLEEDLCSGLISIKTKKHKSLGLLTLLFMQLFFKKNRILSLEEASESIFDKDLEGQTMFKSKVSFYN